MKPTLFFVTVAALLAGNFSVFSQWTQLNNDIDGSTADDRLGSAVTLSANGNRIATGAPLYNNGAAADAGQVRLYEQQGAIWTIIAQYPGTAAGDGLGTSVSLSADGMRLAVSAPLNDTAGNNAGQVYLYHYTAGSWSLNTTLNGELANDQFGSSVSLSADGMRLAVGAPFNDAGTGNAADNRGRVRLYQYNGASWVAFPNALANSINGLAAGDQSGRIVSLSTDGSRVAIGAPLGDGGFADSGYARIFQYNSGTSTWEQLGSALNGEAAGDQSGAAVSLSADGNRVAIGAPLNDADSGIATDNPGHVRVYQYSAGTWTQVGTDLNGYTPGDQFGRAVSLNTDGSRLAVGAPFANGSAGQTQVYQLHGSSWLLLGVVFDGEAGGDEAGSSVSLSTNGSRVVIGAPLNDGGGLSAGQVRLYEYAIPDTSLGEGAGTDASGQANMFLGYYSGHNTTTGSDNTFVGAESGYSNSTGSGNVYLGYRAGYNETTGNDHLFIDNSATDNPLIWGDFAADALRVNGSLQVTNLPQDDALSRVLVADATGNLNWREAATLNTDSQTLSLTGSDLSISNGNSVSLSSLATHSFPSYPDSAGDGGGNTNTYFGHQAGLTNFGLYNTAVGYEALRNNIATERNTAIGFQALRNNIGEQNTASGYQALYANIGGDYNTADGYASLFSNTEGNYNTATGNQALRSNTIGIHNTTSGYAALYTNTDGDYNTANGSQALYANLSGEYNTANGYAALYSNVSGNYNTAIGGRALRNTTGNSNTAVGYYALYNNTIGEYNTAVGRSALWNTTTGNYNTAVGYTSLWLNSTGSNNTALGYNAGSLAGNYSNSTALGSGVLINASNKVRLGNASVTTIEGQVAYTFPSDGRFKIHIEEAEVKGLDFINRLRPVVYNFDTKKFTEFLTQNMPDSIRSRYLENDFKPSTAIRQSGFIAQEVEKAAEEAGYNFNGLHKPDDENDNYSLAYSLFVVPLVKAVQEQQQQIETQQQQLEEQKQENEMLRQKLEAIESVVYGTTKTTQSKTSGETQALPGGFALYQNVPNPFTQTTVIGAQLPESVQQAKIVVYNLQGLELASYPLGERGKVSVEISGGRFPAGMYLYALLADGQVIDTKKMVLTN